VPCGQKYDVLRGDGRSWPEQVALVDGLFGRRVFNMQYLPAISGEDEDLLRPAFGPLYWLLLWMLFFDSSKI